MNSVWGPVSHVRMEHSAMKLGLSQLLPVWPAQLVKYQIREGMDATTALPGCIWMNLDSVIAKDVQMERLILTKDRNPLMIASTVSQACSVTQEIPIAQSVHLEHIKEILAREIVMNVQKERSIQPQERRVGLTASNAQSGALVQVAIACARCVPQDFIKTWKALQAANHALVVRLAPIRTRQVYPSVQSVQ